MRDARESLKPTCNGRQEIRLRAAGSGIAGFATALAVAALLLPGVVAAQGARKQAKPGVRSVKPDPVPMLTAPSATSAFSPASINLYGSSILTITLTNSNTSDLTGVAFSISYTRNLVNDSTHSDPEFPPYTDCGGTDVGVIADDMTSTLELSGGTGATIPAEASCIVQVQVSGLLTGTFSNNSEGNFNVDSDAGTGTGSPATLRITAPSYKVTKKATSSSITNPCISPNCFVTYTITVSNNGSGDATALQIQDTLPAELDYETSSTSFGAITVSSKVITWSPEGLNVGSSATATVVAKPNQAGQIQNCASVISSTPTDNTPAGDDEGCSTFQTTSVSLAGFHTEVVPEGVVVVWETASEVGTASFYLFRQDTGSGEFFPVGNGPFPASLESQEGGIYRLTDRTAPVGIPLTYVLVEQESGGTRNTHGPFTVQPGVPWAEGAFQAGISSSRPIPDLSGDGARIASCAFDAGGNLVLNRSASGSRVHQVALAPVSDFTRTARGITPARAARVERLKTEEAAAKMLERDLLASDVPGRGATGRVRATAKIAVSGDGLKFVDAWQIAGALGITKDATLAAIQAGKLSLSYMKQPVAWLAGNGGITFYKEPTKSLFSNEAVYLLSEGEGATMKEIGTEPSTASTSGGTFTSTRHFERDLVAYMNTADPESDYWQWGYVVGGHETLAKKTFEVRAEGVRSAGPASMTVRLKGGTSFPATPDHHVEFRLNGTFVGEATLAGFSERDVTLAFDSRLLVDGANTVEVTGLLDKGVPLSYTYVNWIDLAYPRAFEAAGNALVLPVSGSGSGKQAVAVSGFTSSDLVVLDVTDPLRPDIVKGIRVTGSGGRYSVEFAASEKKATYFVATRGSAQAPLRVGPAAVAPLLDGSNMADHLLITVPALKAAAAELAALRTRQGVVSKVVLLDEVVDAFNAGNASPLAIRDFLLYTTKHWRKAPTSVVLVGDGTYDYRDILGYGGNLVPALMTATPYGLTSSDSRYVDFDGTGIPRMAIGRLPVLTDAELKTVVQKLAAYDAAPTGSWDRRVVFAADTTTPNWDFSADSNLLVGKRPAADPMDRVYLSALGTSAARNRLGEDLSSGTGFLSYFGHSTIFKFSTEGLLRVEDVPLIRVGEKTPVVTAATCYTNRFDNPSADTLGEVLVLQGEGHGAAAVFSTSGFSLPYQAVKMLDTFYGEIWGGRAKTLGDAVRAAQAGFVHAGGAPWMAATYNLLGDPATPVRYGR